ncbi:phage protease [Asaia bogorensis]|uniref:phage protease n=1 Tax=Asaia bogorensis TaxID=91915 RepID=UPI000EFAABEA|nr:phage protease [Asaia bogorensis]
MTKTVQITPALNAPPPGQVPEWMHVLPAGRFTGRNGVGPFVLDDAQAVIQASLADGKIAIDVNHATDLKGARGEHAPAVGWISAMEARADGIWAKPQFNKAGRHMMSELEYRGVSPVIDSAPSGRVQRILRVALTNTPNLTLTTLHSSQTSETSMDPEEIRALLGLAPDATDDELRAALKAAGSRTTLHSTIAGVVGVPANTDQAALVAALTSKIGGDSAAVSALKAQLETIQKERSQDQASQMFDKAAAEGVVITQEMKESIVTLHSSDAKLAANIVASWPRTHLNKGSVTMHSAQANASGGEVFESLAAGFGIDAADLKKAMGDRHGA